MKYFVIFAIVLAVSVTIGYSYPCPEGWEYFETDRICLKGFKTRTTFAEARKICQSLGGDLPLVDSEEEDDFILNMDVDFRNWIGVIDEKDDKNYRYIDGSELGTFAPWLGGIKNIGKSGRCIIMYGYPSYIGNWLDQSCDEKYAYICSIDATINCPESWVKYPDTSECVKNFDTPLSYHDARQKCQSEIEGGDLVQIKDKEFSNFVIGLNLPAKNWIGVQDANADQIFHYLDGSGLDEFHPWNDGEPNNKGGKEHCGMVYGQGGWAGKWNDANCADAHPFICSTSNA